LALRRNVQLNDSPVKKSPHQEGHRSHYRHFPAGCTAGRRTSRPASGWGNSAPLGLAGFAAWLWLASFRTNAVVVAALGLLAATLFVLGAGTYTGSGLTVEAGGYMGLAVAFLAAYLSCAELCEASYKRAVLPIWPLAKH
jgi:succinate-acetate transporter protein